ncbi:hypothetical protein ACMAZD_20085 [Vibrio sp. nBUS_14]|uniref:hypothetical protein n=1 Tax=unclassified Vibrio TaxID=2614977 RepID=UPI003EBAA621
MSEEIYDKMWQRFKVASETDQYELDSHLLDLPTTHEKGLRVTFDSRCTNCSVLLAALPNNVFAR